MSAPNAPWSARKTMSTPVVGAKAQAAEKTVKPAEPVRNSPAAAEDVAEPGAGNQQDGEGQGVGGAQPLQGAGAAAEVAMDGGTGNVDDRGAHPWMGAQLSRERPWQSAMLQTLESVGERLQALGVPERAQFDCVSALVSYVFGAAAQSAANARLLTRGTDRSAVLATVAAGWAQLDPAQFPFLRQVARQLPEHDDREQFLAGLDLILAGIRTVR